MIGRRLGRGHGRSVDHRPLLAAQLSWVRGWGERPTTFGETASFGRSELYSVEITISSCRASRHIVLRIVAGYGPVLRPAGL